MSVLLFANLAGLGPVGMSWVTLALLGGWLAAAYIAQRQYVLNLQDSIHNYRLDAERAIDHRPGSRRHGPAGASS